MMIGKAAAMQYPIPCAIEDRWLVAPTLGDFIAIKPKARGSAAWVVEIRISAGIVQELES